MSDSIKRYDDKFEDFLNRLTFEQVETDLTPQLRAQRRALADSSGLEFCKIYFPHIFNDVWNPLHIHINSLRSGNYLVSGSRFFGKSAFTLIGRLIRHIVIGGVGLVGLAMRTQDDSLLRGDSLVRLIKRNKMLCYDYDVQFQQDNKGAWIINNKTFVTVGVNEGLRNLLDENFKRFELLILDDLYNRHTVSSDKDNEKVYNFVASEAYGQMEPGGLSIWLFNLITEKSPGALRSAEVPDLWFNLPALNDEDETNWPGSSVYTTAYLHNKRASIPFDVWLGDWMNKPCQVGEIFDLKWIRGVNINTVKIIASLTAIDPSFGKSPSACYKGVVTLGVSSEDKYYILDVYLRKEDYGLVFDYIDNIRLFTPCWKVLLFEDDFSQFSIAEPYYKQWCDKRKKVLPVFPITTQSLKTENYGSDKEGRIMNLVYPHQSGQMLYNQDIFNSRDFSIFRNQYLSFGKSKDKLDGLDALATAFILIKRYVGGGSFKPISMRAYKDKLFRKI